MSLEGCPHIGGQNVHKYSIVDSSSVLFIKVSLFQGMGFHRRPCVWGTHTHTHTHTLHSVLSDLLLVMATGEGYVSDG